MSYSLSIWEKSSSWFDRDYVIIGGGISGMMAALNIALTSPNATIAIIESQPIGTMATTRNAGFACFGSISELESDKRAYGIEKTLEILKLRFKGLDLLRSLLGDTNLRYQNSGGKEVFDSKVEYDKFSALIPFWNNCLADILGVADTFSQSKLSSDLGFYDSMIFNRLEGLIDSGRLMLSLERRLRDCNIDIFRGVRLSRYDTKIQNVDLYFDQISDCLRCKKLILCTNSLTQQLIPDINIEPSRNQIIVTSKVNTEGFSGGYHFDSGYTYFRAVGDRILIGGSRNYYPEENNKNELGPNQENIDHLVHLLKTRILRHQEFSVDMSWSGILTGGVERTPIIKRIDERVVVAARLGGMGVAIGAIVGQEAATLAVEDAF